MDVGCHSILNNYSAKKTGAILSIKSNTFGLVLAYLLMAFISSNLLWIARVEYGLNLFAGVILTYLFSYILGSFAGSLVLQKKWPALISGVVTAFITVWVSTFFASLIGFFNEGVQDNSPLAEPMKDYVLKPILSITLYGFGIVTAAGILYGALLQKAEFKNRTENIKPVV